MDSKIPGSNALADWYYVWGGETRLQLVPGEEKLLEGGSLYQTSARRKALRSAVRLRSQEGEESPEADRVGIRLHPEGKTFSKKVLGGGGENKARRQALS